MNKQDDPFGFDKRVSCVQSPCPVSQLGQPPKEFEVSWSSRHSGQVDLCEACVAILDSIPSFCSIGVNSQLWVKTATAAQSPSGERLSAS